eukprot:243050_1
MALLVWIHFWSHLVYLLHRVLVIVSLSSPPHRSITFFINMDSATPMLSCLRTEIRHSFKVIGIAIIVVGGYCAVICWIIDSSDATGLQRIHDGIHGVLLAVEDLVSVYGQCSFIE